MSEMLTAEEYQERYLRATLFAREIQIAELESYQHNYEHATKIEREESNARIAELEAQVRELEADRERLDWWLAHSGCAICSGGKTYAVYGVYSDRITGWHDTPRGALDEALGKEKA